VLVFNTASDCKFTPQLKGLEHLKNSISSKYADDFVILGFPCNQFAKQESGTNQDIQTFCTKENGVTFPVLGKTEVNGDDAEPVWKWLTKEKPWKLFGLTIEKVKWNFEKFLIGRDGKVVERWTSVADPKSLKTAIEAELAKGKTGKTGL
jgi:peroxiredoxin